MYSFIYILEYSPSLHLIYGQPEDALRSLWEIRALKIQSATIESDLGEQQAQRGVHFVAVYQLSANTINDQTFVGVHIKGPCGVFVPLPCRFLLACSVGCLYLPWEYSSS